MEYGRRGPGPEAGRLEKDIEILNRRLQGETLEEIGQDLGITRERVRQRQNRALHKLPAVRSLPMGARVAKARQQQEDELKRASMLSEFRRLRAQLHRKPSPEDLSDPEAALRVWGSLSNLAQEAAGGDPLARLSLTPEELDYWFDHACKRLGRAPTMAEMVDICDIGSVNWLYENSGWSKYVYSRGYWPYRCNDREFMREVLIENYNQVKERLGHIPTTGELSRHGAYTIGCYSSIHWDSYYKFLEEVGDLDEYRAHPVKGRRKWNKERISEAVIKLASKLGHPPTMLEMMQEYKMSSSSINRYAGSYPDLLTSLGMKPRRAKAKRREQ